MQNDNPVNIRSEFDQDFANAFDAASRAEALDWARQFGGGAAAPAPAPAPNAPAGAEGTLPPPREELGIGRDISIGLISSPRSAARGAVKGVNNMLGFLQELEKITPQLTLLNEEGEYSYPRITSLRENRERLNTRAAAAGDKTIDLDAPVLPVPDAPAVPTVTGNIVETISQFLVGFKGADKVIKGGSAAANIAKGAVGDLLAFDKHEERLSNVIQSVPELQNPVTEYLAANPEDGAAEAKFKQAVEGLALGGIGEGLFRGVAALKKGKAAADDMKAAGKKPEDIFQTPREEAAGIGVEGKNFDFLGDASDEALLRRRQQKLIEAEDEVKAAFGKPKALQDGPAAHIDDYEINFARIEGPDDIKRLMDDMVNRPELKPSIEAARRGKRGAEQTLKAAQDIDGFDSLMARRTGDAFNAEQIVAARKVYYDTTDKLMEAAKRAASPDASDIDVFNFRRLVTMHHAVQKEFMGVRAEAGRALAAWRMPLGGTAADNARMLQEMLADAGGADVGKALAAKIAAVGDSLNTAQLNAITQKGAMARSVDAVSELWTMGILTNPTTHVVNLFDSYGTGLMLGMERMAMTGAKDSPVTMREGTAFFMGWLQAHKGALKNAAHALRTGEVGMGMGKVDLPRTRASSREILDPQGKAGFLSKAVDGYGLVLQKYVGGLLAAGDEFNKTLMYNAQLQALATRQGIAQGLEGQALKEHIARALTDPSAAPLRAEAVDFANYATYTKQLEKGGRDVQGIINQYPLLRFVVPFVRTPANIFKFTFSRTPLGLLSQNIRDDIAAGGIRAANAKTRMAMGTGIMAVAADMSMNGIITGDGPADPKIKAALRRTGWQPNSIKIGDTYYSYQRMGYLGTMLGMSAGIAEILTNYEAYDIDMQSEADQLVLAAAISASNQVMGKTFMTGFADLVEVLSDPGRYGENYINRMAGSFVPAGVAAVERAINPETSEVFNMIDALRARIPGLSDSAPVRRNIWGEPIQAFYPEATTIAGATAERLETLFNPVYRSREKDAPVDKWLLQNGFTIDMPQKTQVFSLSDLGDKQIPVVERGSARIDLRDFPKAYDRLVELRGDGIPLTKYGNQTMKEFFQSLASEQDPFGRHLSFFMAIGNSYEDQQNFIRAVVSDYTKAARAQVAKEFKEIPQAILKEMDKQRRLNDVRQPIRAGGEQ
ncbi:MAG TPA: hypothetical protein PLW48_03795 [Alphaproteobacteria bacterium]|nr:hypothetical protein [Rhodospirillaceae bacterium]HRJ66235.1 hypothetical protein [Alphaproteobacteria bacterium]